MASRNIAESRNWGDEDEEDLDENDNTGRGNRTYETVATRVNQKGQKVFYFKNILFIFYQLSCIHQVKTISIIQVKEIRNKVPLRALSRKNLTRFGDARVGETNVTLLSPDFISIEHPEDQLLEDNADSGVTNSLLNFITKQQEKSMQREFNLQEEEKKGPLDVDVVPASSSGLYVAPGNRRKEGGGANDYGFGDTKDGTENTLRVSNLTKSVTEDDLRELFGRFGRIHRISLPRNEFKEPRGFAYIAFAMKEDAEVALTRLDGHGYDHLIIKVEWAKVIFLTVLLHNLSYTYINIDIINFLM
jgi:translation initiation factor 3 subunit G